MGQIKVVSRQTNKNQKTTLAEINMSQSYKELNKEEKLR